MPPGIYPGCCLVPHGPLDLFWLLLGGENIPRDTSWGVWWFQWCKLLWGRYQVGHQPEQEA